MGNNTRCVMVMPALLFLGGPCTTTPLTSTDAEPATPSLDDAGSPEMDAAVGVRGPSTSDSSVPPMIASDAGAIPDGSSPVLDASGLLADAGGIVFDAASGGDGGFICEGDSACFRNVARTCDGTQSLDCSSFGATCRYVTLPTGEGMHWCDCGSLNRLEVACPSASEFVVCTGGIGISGSCEPGTQCGVRSDGMSGMAGCLCDNAADGVCPTTRDCLDDPDC